MRKLWCEERLKKGFDKLSIDKVREMAGFIEPKKNKWEVTTLFEGEGYTADSEFEANVIANQEMIIGLLLRKRLLK